MHIRMQPLGCCAISCCLLLAACGGSSGGSGDHSHGADDHDHGVAAIQPGVWPPTLQGIDNEQALPPPVRVRGTDVVIASARNSVRNNPRISDLLGNNYREYEASGGHAKDGTIASFLFFNYDTNTTIDVKMTSDGSLTHTLYAATDFQPTENADEVVEAITLGGAALESDGVDISSLQGTAMLAYQPSQGNSTTSQYYSARVLYVTFGPGNGVEPNYWALVNLSQQSVMDSGEVL